MVCACDEDRSNKLRTRIVGRRDGLGTVTASESAWVVRRPDEQIARGILKHRRHRYQRELDGSGPHAHASTRCRRCCLGSGVDIDLGGRGPWPAVTGFGQGLNTQVLGLCGLKGRGLEGVVVNPSTESHRIVVDSVGTRGIISMDYLYDNNWECGCT